MTQLSIEVLRFIANIGKPTNSDVIIEHFKSYTKDEILKSIDQLCGATASSGYIVWHKPSRSDYPDFDRLQITLKGKELV